MKAVVWTKYGPPDVLELKEIEKPTPSDNEILIRIYAASVTMGDCELRSIKVALFYRFLLRLAVGFRKPKRITILGMELAGEIESIGKDVKLFKKGDQIFAATSLLDTGTYTEYKCLPEEPKEGALAIKPVNMTYEEAAVVPIGGLEALHFLRQGKIQRGSKILINGAGGTIGSFAVQLAKYFGAEVTAVDSTLKLDMLRSIGADKVIDYTQENFTESAETYDFIIDLVNKGSFSGSIRSLKEKGIILFTNIKLSLYFRRLWTKRKSSKRVIFGNSRPKTEDLIFLRELIEAGKLKSIIDRIYPLEQAVEAHRYVETGDKKGNVVINVIPMGESL